MPNKVTNYQLKSYLLGTILALVGISSAYAAGTAIRSPAVPDGTDQTVMQTGGVIDLNPGRASVAVDTGYTSVTSIRVDTDAGISGGYAEFDMDSDMIVPISATLGSSATGVNTLETTLLGPGSDPVELIAELSFDGLFDPIDGQPSLLLLGNLSATVLTGFPPTGVLYQSQLIFELTLADGSYEPNTIFTGVESSLLPGSAMTDYDGASVNIISSAEDDLNATLRLSFMAAPGDMLILSGLVSGIAGPEPGDSSVEGGELDVRASAGAVDFSETGIFSIQVPDGYSFSGDDPLIAGAVSTVPLPAGVWLLFSGIAALIGLRRA